MRIGKEEAEFIQSTFPTGNYVFRKHIFNGVTCFDIVNENLNYADMPPTHHGLQCNHVGGTPEHMEIMKLCDQVVETLKRIEELNNIKNEEKA